MGYDTHHVVASWSVNHIGKKLAVTKCSCLCLHYFKLGFTYALSLVLNDIYEY